MKADLKERYIRSMPCREQNRAMRAIASLVWSLDPVPSNVRMSVNAYLQFSVTMLIVYPYEHRKIGELTSDLIVRQ